MTVTSRQTPSPRRTRSRPFPSPQRTPAPDIDESPPGQEIRSSPNQALIARIQREQADRQEFNDLLAHGGNAKGTRKTYSAHLRLWQKYCDERHLGDDTVNDGVPILGAISFSLSHWHHSQTGFIFGAHVPATESTRCNEMHRFRHCTMCSGCRL